MHDKSSHRDALTRPQADVLIRLARMLDSLQNALALCVRNWALHLACPLIQHAPCSRSHSHLQLPADV